MEKYQKNILAVCLGNINRSPAVEFLLKEKGFKNVKSCGIGKTAGYGNKMTRKMQAALGITFPEHRSQRVSEDLIEWADVVIVQTEKQKDKLLKIISFNESKLYVFGEVADPYHTKDYAQTATDIRKEVDKFESIVDLPLSLI